MTTLNLWNCEFQGVTPIKSGVNPDLVLVEIFRKEYSFCSTNFGKIFTPKMRVAVFPINYPSLRGRTTARVIFALPQPM